MTTSKNVTEDFRDFSDEKLEFAMEMSKTLHSLATKGLIEYFNITAEGVSIKLPKDMDFASLAKIPQFTKQ